MRCVVITGTSSGLGKALLELLCEQELTLICIARRFLPAQKNLSEKKDNIILYTKNLTDTKRVEELNAFLHSQFIAGSFQEIVYINNAATIEPLGSIGELDNNLLIEAVNINFTVPMLIIDSLASYYAKYGTKVKVIHLSTGAAQHPIVGWPAYCATKAGMKMFLDVLTEQFKDTEEFQINQFDPGVLNTNMQVKIRNTPFPKQSHFIELQKSGKLNQPSDVAKIILDRFICNADCSSV